MQGTSDRTRNRYRHRRATSFAVATAAAVVSAATSGAAVAAIPAANGTIKGCYANVNSLLLGIPHSKGDARIVDENEGCRSYETTLRWNQTGPRGPAGPQGATGAAGADGVPGAPGISRATLVGSATVSNIANPTALTKVTSESLPAGSWAIVATTNMEIYRSFGEDMMLTSYCELRNGAGVIGAATDRRSTPSDQVAAVSLSLNGGAQLAAPGEVSLWCRSQRANGASAQMVIMQVGSFF